MKTGTKNLLARRGFMKTAFCATTLVAATEGRGQDLSSSTVPTAALSSMHTGSSIGSAKTGIDADDVFTLDDPTQSFFCRLNGSVSTVVRVVLSKTKRYLVFPIMIGPPSAYIDGQLIPLFSEDGTVDPQQVAGKNAAIHIEVSDVLASQELSSQVYAALENEPTLSGKTWAQPRVRRAVRVTLNLTDPFNGGQQRALATCLLNRKDGQVAHDLFFRIDNEVDLAALKSASRKQLSLEFAVEAYCRVSEAIALGQASVITASTLATANELLSKAGEDINLIMATGGGLDSRSALLSTMRRRVESEISLRKGEQVPTEIVNGILDRIIGSSLQTVNLQAADQQQKIAIILGNQLLVTTPIGEVRGALSNIKKLVEANDTREIFDGKRHSVAGGANFFGIGASGSASSEEQRREMTNKLRRDLNEAEKSFSAALPTIVAMRAKSLNEMVAADSMTVELMLSRFAVRWHPLVAETSLEITDTSAVRLHALLKERNDLMKQICDGVEQLKLAAEADSKTAESAATDVMDVHTLKTNVLDDALQIKRYEAFEEFARHVQVLGRGDAALTTYHNHMRHSVDGKRRELHLVELKDSLRQRDEQFSAEVSAVTKQIGDFKKRSDDRATAAESLMLKITRLARLSSEIETSLRLGVK